jgi:hypothetical protein
MTFSAFIPSPGVSAILMMEIPFTFPSFVIPTV